MKTPVFPRQLASAGGLLAYSPSICEAGDAFLLLAQTGTVNIDTPVRGNLGILAEPGSPLLTRFDGQTSEVDGESLLLCALTHRNAVVLRDLLPWLQPRPLGLATSAGYGDRLGLATPGHIRAAKTVGKACRAEWLNSNQTTHESPFYRQVIL